MTYLECKQMIEDDGYDIMETDRFIIVSTSDSEIKYDKKTNIYTASGYGSPLTFTTFPIYEPWRNMIKAWKAEQRKTE